jgi:hypothetical protein
MKRSYSLCVLTRLVRFIVVVPSTAFLLRCVRPEMPWWSWCGISGLTLLFLWFIDGCVAYSRWHRRRRETSGLRSAADR